MVVQYFFSITALEEVTKTNLSYFLKYDENLPRKKDIMMDHAKKYKFSISPVFKIGTRLINAIGEEKVDQLIDLVGKNEKL